jgi:acetylglutamate/LysW-gamma-L-alpha-aminoadipate kinase
MIILKIGGGRSINLEGIAADLAAVTEPVLIVHGANAARDELAAALHRETTVVTSMAGVASVLSDQRAIELLMMAYAGLQNKRLVEHLQRHGVNAVGLSGLDGRIVTGRRNRGIRVREGDKVKVLRDRSGKPRAVNRELLDLLLAAGYTPVLTMPILDEHAEAINSENDDVVALLQETYHAKRVIQLIEAQGLLRDPADARSTIPALGADELADLERVSLGRIRRKLHALNRLLASSAPVVVIADGRREHPLADALAGIGTVIVVRTRAGGVTA